MGVYKTEFYGGYKFSDNTPLYIIDYLKKYFRTCHIVRDVEKIKSVPEWEKYSFYGNLGYEGELYVNPDDKSHGNKNLLAITKWCHFSIKEKDNCYYLIWNGNSAFYHYEEWLKYIIKRFLAPYNVELNGVMLSVGMEYSDSNYIVIYKNTLSIYYAKDNRELERLRKDYRNSNIILNIVDKILTHSSYN